MTGLPLPARVVPHGTLRRLPGRVLRVDAAARPEIIDAVTALAAAAFDVTVTAGGAAPDVVLVDERVEAPAPLGADPRPGSRRGCSEAYRIRPAGDRLTIAAGSAEGHFRGLVTLLGACSDVLPGLEVDDHPLRAWRGLSLDVVRRRFPVDEVCRVIDLLAVHGLNVLHLHLTDTQGWAFAVPGYAALADDDAYTAADLDALEAYAHGRFVTIVPEVDVPGHVPARMARVVPVRAGVHPFLTAIDADDPGVEALLQAAFGELAARFASPHLHLGGDEAFGASVEGFARTVAAASRIIRARGRTPIGWQEASRAGALAPGDLGQLWIADRDRLDPEKATAAVPVEFRALIAQAAPLFAESAHDAARLGAAGVGVIVSSSDPLYLDRRPSEASLDATQHEAWQRLGNPGYEPTSSLSILDWHPESQPDIAANGLTVAGIEAALWCETVRDLDDAATLLLPRLALVAQKAWGDADRDRVTAAAASSAPVWERLGFGAFHRSRDIFRP
ncbi:family 20 glycosylhydrolase [Microbacterium horticulturae]|uniref:beta-N-acetylhexosaminidase n=1 Tax=Microbacterium horticulturae TaxID=3028316 RepID=A0ABY8BZE5_9MICO|nr:family 20 glycosylhydrolase [Microbacterium sp. KACC 23027]WEG09320.1 family 20 glycosylhydrolase [Microbacterium sp. KACC 23027]